MQFESLYCEIRGVRGLVMHSDKLADPLAPITKEMKAISGKRKKTDEDIEQMAQIEFLAGMYYDPELGPYIPGRCFQATIVSGAKLCKMGTAIKRSVEVITEKAQLGYEGPRKDMDLWNNANFRLTCSVKVQTSRIMRTRPIFPSGWKARFEIRYDPKTIDRAQILRIIADAGDYVGILDYRPYYGKFLVREIDKGEYNGGRI